VSKIRAALLGVLWLLVIYFGKQRMINSLEPLALVPSLALTVVLAVVFVVPCSVVLMSLLFGD